MRRWLPLEDATRPDVWSDISNAIPTARGTYRNAPGFSAGGTTTSSPGTILTAWQGILPDGTTTKLAGTTSKLYTWSGTTFTDRSIGGGYSNSSAWSFAQYGVYTIATNGVDTPQVRDASGAGAFANLGGTPPTHAKYAVVQSNVLLLLNSTSGGHYWHASDVGNHANFTTGEAASGFIASRPGDITGAIAFRDEVIVFKENACFRMRYVGSPIFWTVDLISDAHGAVGQGSICSAGDFLVVCDYKNGAYVFDGASFRRIDEGFKGYLVQLVLAPNASQYFRNQESIWFNTPTQTCIVYNLKSNAWGKFTAAANDSTSLTGAHVLMTGSGIYDEMRGATMIDPGQGALSILSSYAEDENASDNTALNGYVTSGLIGKTGRMTNVTRVTPLLKVPDSIIGTKGVPTAAALTMTPFTQVTPEASSTTGTTVSCSTTAEKRFDYIKSSQWHKFKVIFTDTPWEITDIDVAAMDGGVSP